MTCYFAHLGPCSYRADGLPDKIHWIPAQRLRKAGLSDAQVHDPRVTDWACRRHHDRLDGRNAIRKIEMTEADYPDTLLEFAREHGFGFIDSRTGWVALSGSRTDPDRKEA